MNVHAFYCGLFLALVYFGIYKNSEVFLATEYLTEPAEDSNLMEVTSQDVP